MKKRPRPFFRKPRGLWYIQIGGKQFNLGPDKTSAKRQADELLKQHYKPRVPSSSAIAVFDQFLSWCKQNRAEGTFDWYFWRINSFQQSLPADLSAGDIEPIHLDAWLTNHGEWGRTMRHGCIRAVQRAFRWAKKHKLIGESPIDDYEKPRPQKRKVIIPPDDFESIRRNVKNKAFLDLLTVSWETGARPQETLIVESRHVDLNNSRWIFQPEESKGEEGEEIARVVYLNDSALALTKRLMLKHRTGPLFRNSQGRPWTTDAVHCAFGRLAEKVGKKHCLYHFRHSWLDRALKSGLDALTCAVLMGHRDPSTISRVYQHLSQSPAFLRESLNRVSRRGA